MKTKIQNRKRCLNCKHYSRNCCPIMANTDVFKIDKCILEYDDVKNILPNSIEEFIFQNHPITFLQWISKDKTLEIDDEVTTLRGGFGSIYCGKILKITSFNDKHYFATDGEDEYCIKKEDWYMHVFKLSKENEEVSK